MFDARPSSRPVWLDRFLHRSYSSSARFRYFITRRIRPAGIGAGLALIVAAGLGPGHGQRSVYQLFSFTLGMGLVALPWAFARNAKLVGRRDLPRYGTAGYPLHYTIHVTNVGRKKVRNAWLSETPPDPRPPLADFRNSREPGEEERNWFDRTLVFYRWQWLISSRRIFEGGHAHGALSLEPGETCSCSLEIVPLRRGVISLEDLRVLLPDPLGLFQRCRKTETPPSTLTILPKRYPLPFIGMPGSSRFQIGGEAATNAIGNSGEFVGLRDYRPGDPPRQIHWKSWARTGRPIIKELEDTFYPRYGLILDTFATPNASHRFEEAVSVAASFAIALDTGETLLDLMFIKDTAHVVTAGRGFARTEKLLEILAGVEAESEMDYDPLTRLVLRHREELTSCLVIFSDWDDRRAAFLQSLARGGIACAALVIGEGSAPTGVPVHWLESGQVRRDLQRLPANL